MGNTHNDVPPYFEHHFMALAGTGQRHVVVCLDITSSRYSEEQLQWYRALPVLFAQRLGIGTGGSRLSVTTGGGGGDVFFDHLDDLEGHCEDLLFRPPDLVCAMGVCSLQAGDLVVFITDVMPREKAVPLPRSIVIGIGDAFTSGRDLLPYASSAALHMPTIDALYASMVAPEASAFLRASCYLVQYDATEETVVFDLSFPAQPVYGFTIWDQATGARWVDQPLQDPTNPQLRVTVTERTLPWAIQVSAVLTPLDAPLPYLSARASFVLREEGGGCVGYFTHGHH